MATAKQGTCCKTLLFPKFEACVIQPSTRTSYKSSGNFLAASNMKQGQTSWNVLITSKDSSLEEIGSNDKSICRGWLAIMPCKDVGKAADSADLPKPTDTETLVVFFCKEKVCPVAHPAVLRWSLHLLRMSSGAKLCFEPSQRWERSDRPMA